VVVCFVHIGGINNHHCLEVVVCFVDIDGFNDQKRQDTKLPQS
jgi:hypothetical protein